MSKEIKKYFVKCQFCGKTFETSFNKKDGRTCFDCKMERNRKRTAKWKGKYPKLKEHIYAA